MTTRKLSLSLVALLLAAVPFSPPRLSAEPWTHEESDLKPDGKAVFGRLENGLRYVIYPNKFPVEGRASIRLFVDAGSLMEEDDQQGMAHFLEHMAFNGSKNFAAGTMVERFQRLGMGFGADTNAHTSFRETVYKLELPKVDEKMLTEGLHLFRDDLDGMLLGEEEIDKERGVILSEKLARDSVETRVMEAGYEFAMPDSLLPKRFPIGKEETIKGMKRQRFVDFYQKWYTPKRAVVIVAGDVDIPLVERLIKENFSDAKAQVGDSPDQSLGKITEGRGLVAKLHTELEAPATEISIEVVKPADKEGDSVSRRREKMIRNLADGMVNQRLSELAKKENSPVIEAEAYNFDMFKFVANSGVYAKCKPENWEPALNLAEQELRRALQHGFTPAEFAEAKATYLKGIRLRAEGKDTRKNAELADGFVRALGSELVFTDPEDDLKRVEKELVTVTAEDCLTSLRDAWKGNDIQIFIGGNLKLDNASETILAAYKASAAKPVAAPAQGAEAVFAYSNFGEPGKVVARNDVKDLEIIQVVFANQVRLNLKKTDFEKNSIRVAVNFGGGKLDAPADKPGMVPYAQSVFRQGGLEKHSMDDLRRIFASKTVSTEFAIGDDTFTLAGKTNPQDLDAQLQLLCATLSAPGYREEADRQFKMNLEAVYQELEHTAEGVMQNKVVGFIHSDDFRFVFPPREEMGRRTLTELKAWLTPMLKDGYMEITVLGDIEVEKTIELVAATFGTLPKRADKRPNYDEARKMTFPEGPRTKDIKFTTEIPRAYALAYWPTDDMLDVKRTRRLILLGQILDDRLRLKIREELGETYSPTSYHVASDTFPGYGYMTAMATLKPEQVEQVKPMFLEIAEGIIKEGISDDEFQRAREPQLQQLVQMRRDNRYWLTRVLPNCQSQPYRLEWCRSLVDDFTGIKKEELNDLAKTYLGGAKSITMGLLPELEKAPEGAGKAAAAGSVSK
ncbi:M16 family metallopeptidase [Verrucomicrobium spinosum]|uniref:M16 family metallopeptidase n=2 Tax=Verrucomicrobium spinosum TaxID=2736 RepID=UPI00017463CB|nr:insulinase family protein [Verrucomicrobium spinosum]